jgi:hypothetical protein
MPARRFVADVRPAVFDGMQIAPRHQLLKRTVLPMEPGGLVFPS